MPFSSPSARHVRARARFSLTAFSLAFGAIAAAAQAQPADPPATATPSTNKEATLPVVRVQAGPEGAAASERTGDYTVRRSSSATGLPLAPRETPQSTSVVTRATMDDFRFTSVNSVLDAVTGITVERPETDRTYYTARGFDIVNFQLDGIGLPFSYGLVDGDLDTAVYDRVEVVRGANGLMTGAGNPSATINFIRKRPTAKTQASAALTLGSWRDKRLEGDLSGPLNADGSVRGRLVAVAQQRESHLDRHRHAKGVLYGIVEADIGENTTLAAGHTQQRNRPKGVMWGALPLQYTDGSATNYDVSTSTSPDWTYWNTATGITFAELKHQLAGEWQATAVITHKKNRQDSKLFYVYGTPDAATGTGLAAWPSMYRLDSSQLLLDARASGPVMLGGRRHDVVVGASTSRTRVRANSTDGQGVGSPVPDLATWDGTYAEPAFDITAGSADFTDRQHSVYGAVRINASDAWKFIAGANATWVKSSGITYGEPRERDEQSVEPYVGAIFDLNRDVSVYASYAGIFNPQHQVDANLRTLDPVTGTNREIGVKTEWLDKRLQTTLAVFKGRQDNLAEWSAYVGTIPVYVGRDTLSQGVEAEVTGSLTDRVRLTASYTQVQIEDTQGKDVRTFSPRKTLRAATTWQATDKLKLGATYNWRSATHRDGVAGVAVRQPSYGILNLMARYDFSKQWSASINIDNATNEKYLTSLYWSQGFYGAPRSGSVTLAWTY